jgi:hypothetical protein
MKWIYIVGIFVRASSQLSFSPPTHLDLSLSEFRSSQLKGFLLLPHLTPSLSFSLSPILEFCFICWILNSDLDLRSRFSSKRYLLFDLFFWKEVTQKEEQDAERSTQEGCFFVSDFIIAPFVFRVCYWILNSQNWKV